MSQRQTPIDLDTNPFQQHPDVDRAGDRAPEGLRATSTSKQPPLEQSQTHHDHDHLTLAQTVTSAAHAAKEKLHLHSIHATGPSKFFNPTNVRVHVGWHDDHRLHPSHTHELGAKLKERVYLWRSRDNRKGRKSIAVPANSSVSTLTPRKDRFRRSFRRISSNVLRMCTTFAYWDMAFWSGWSYSIGSILFVIDGSWAFRDEAGLGSQSGNLTTYGGPLCFFFGALLYQLGAVMAYLEAVNDGSFQGSAMQRFLEGDENTSRTMVDEKIHAFFGHFAPSHLHHGHSTDGEATVVDTEAGWKTKDDQRQRSSSMYPGGRMPSRRGGVDMGEVDEGTSKQYMTWRWYPSWHVLKTHHVYEIGYVACTIQLFGATLYGITGVVVLPGILDSLADWQEEAAFWIPQIVASTCFLTAGILFTLETQEKWWRPEPTVLGWWIGAWAVVGSIGFLWIGIAGAASFDIEWGEYQADLGTIWGSGAYLISSLLQWYEAMNKQPVEELFDEPGEMKSYEVHPI